MSGLFQRLFKTGQAEAHALVDKFEDPIKMSEQAIRDLKKDLQESMKALAEVKSVAIRLERDADQQSNRAKDYERKAMLLVQKSQDGSLDATEADRLATESLTRMEEESARHSNTLQQCEQQKNMADKLQSNVNDLKTKINHYENDLVTLKARTKTAQATRKINQHLANVDSKGTVALLDRMKERVEEQEALATAYGDMAESSNSVDDEINKAIGDDGANASDALAKLKAKMGV
ncbi:MAG: phage shock protein A [Gemmatimonadetes bacterium]|jgi:phage shock protein A|nr:phage shock protein A [Gemmatimonadota bacterium]